MNKQFLYLVQSRIKHLDNYLDIESDDSDALFATFEKQIDQPNYIYIPNTVWAEGRNALVDTAKKLPQKYHYYILLDDDIEFATGNFREFEQAILSSRPDFATPNYLLNASFYKYYNNINRFFDYTTFLWFDSAFICLSSELFFDQRLLPYHTAYQTVPIFQDSFYPSRLFWINLFEFFNDKRLLVINKVKIVNGVHMYPYNKQYCYSILRNQIRQDYPDYTFRIEKAIPGIYLERFMDKFPFREHIITRCFRSIIRNGLLLVFGSLALVRDAKLNAKLKKPGGGG